MFYTENIEILKYFDYTNALYFTTECSDTL